MHWALIEDSRHESVHPRESAWKWAPLKICADFSCMSRAGLVACCIYAELHIKGWCCRVSQRHPPASNWDLLITHLAENSAFDAMYKIAKHCTAGHTRHPDERCKYKGHYLWAWLFPICMFTFLHVQYLYQALSLQHLHLEDARELLCLDQSAGAIKVILRLESNSLPGLPTRIPISRVHSTSKGGRIAYQ